VPLRRLREAARVNVAERHDLHFLEGGHLAEIAATLPPETDVRSGQCIGRRRLSAASNNMAPNDERRDAGGDDVAEKPAAGGDGLHSSATLTGRAGESRFFRCALTGPAVPRAYA